MEGLRLAAVRVDAELMYGLFRAQAPGEWYRVERGLPPDAEYVRSYYDEHANHFVFVFTHPTFPLTRPGQPVAMVADVSVSVLHLTAPLDAKQCECVEKLIGEQSRRVLKALGEE